jgi:hypothetical protein
MSKKGQIGFDDMAMLAFSRAILLTCVRVGYVMRDAKLGEERAELLIFTSPICLHRKNPTIELSLDKGLELLIFF